MPPVSKLGRGKALKSQSKEILHKLHRYFETQIARDPNSTVTAAQLVVHSTGVSMNALKRVITEYKTNNAARKECKIVTKRTRRTAITNEHDAQSIRRIIHDFYTKEEEFPIMKDLYLLLKAEIDYQGSLGTLRRHISKLGFRWVQTTDNNCVLVEKQDTRFVRLQYLTKIETYKAEGRHIVYLGEDSIESNRTSSRPKPDGTSTILKQPAKSKVTILLAGDYQTLLGGTLAIFEANKRDFKEDVWGKKENYEQHEKWLKNVLIVLKPNSVVVVDGGSSFHNRLASMTPHSNSRKREMADWLTARNIPHSADMYKPQLYQLVLLNKDKYYDYKTDAVLREQGHIVLRIPAQHPDLNPVKKALVSIKDYLGDVSVLNAERLVKIANEKLSSWTKSEWQQTCNLVEAEENHLKAVERYIDAISEKTFRNIDDSDSENSDVQDENGTDQESMDSD